jgi:hypothetical protein
MSESDDTVDKTISTDSESSVDPDVLLDLGAIDLDDQGVSVAEKEVDEVLSRETNTAQEVFVNVLSTMEPNHAIELRFDQVMHGDLDFSILRDQDFKKIKTIIFEQPGQTTHLRNLPEGIEKIECRHQILTTLDKLPSTLVDLDFTDNALTKFDGESVPALTILRLSNNELMEITNLPTTLERLECESNQLRRLDLTGLVNLKVLHCSNNPLLIVENLTEGLEDFDMENSPLMEMGRSSTSRHDEDKDKDGSGSTDVSVNRRLDYLENIYEYYRLKSAYDEKTKKMKRDAFEKASNKRAGIKRARAVKPSCIYCKRQVGTIFSTTNATYRAICGDKSKPCALNINIFNGDNFNMLQLLSIYQEDVVDAKNDIIRQKLDTIFHYTKDEKSVKMFKDTLEKYNKTSKMYTDLMIRYQELYENPEASEQLKRKHQEMYRVQEQISILKREYEKTGEKEVLTTMVETYKDELIPIIQNIRLLKYDTMAVETSEDHEHWTSTLVQHHVALYKRDFIYGESPRVIKFDMV